MSLRWLAIVVLLGAAVAASAVAVVQAKHRSRTLFVELQQLEREVDALNAEWRRLRLEQGTLATHGRVERIARESLGLREPQPGEVIVLRVPSADGEGQP
ncbi:cell division protein FtsL [Sediminicurvatus halobius]|uniref:Cell division protein FtsL n=1 Tax=Sediminicurvatus halobius TaxID=2182432 RepID=A0A2U2N7S0_9GAMM|nr:cell division protein FtsL [Spiribacter halobius]PWG65180.1 cell division protein FtsL [Spiribacter halobius]UEX78867.1 cell division protein FtsL [Spiribacter halobius]